MPTVIITTCADPNRPGLTYKLEMPSWAMQEWYHENLILEGKRRIEPMFRGPANTSFTIIEGTNVQTETYGLTWEQVTKLLQDADFAYPDLEKEEVRRPGRPEKRVLIMTTSKERRTSLLVAKTGY